MFHPKSLLLLNSSGISLCIQENHQELFSWLSRSISLSQSTFQNQVPAPRQESRESPDLRVTRRWPTLHSICSFLAMFANYHQVGKNVQKSNVPGRTWLVQNLFLSIFTDFFSLSFHFGFDHYFSNFHVHIPVTCKF